MNKPVYFYSKKCDKCNNLSRIIVNGGIGPALMYACIDEPNVRRALPPFIRSVPSVYIQQTNQIFSGSSAFTMIENMIQQLQKKEPRQQQNPNGYMSGEQFPLNPQKPQQKQKNEEIMAFVSTEMCTGDECYSFLDQKNPFERTYYYYDGVKTESRNLGAYEDPKLEREGKTQLRSNQIQQQPQQQRQQQFYEDLPKELQPQEVKKGKGNDLENRMMQYQQSRDFGMPTPINRY
jgi:hypothetical protein